MVEMPCIYQGQRKEAAEDGSYYLCTQGLGGHWMGLSVPVIKGGVFWRLSEEGTRGICWKGLLVTV